jgi:8-oxo-dGTP pyrophosphatase MutT (NUDIX family)
MNEQPTENRPIVATSSKIAYENRWLKVREDDTLRLDGTKGLYGVVETNDSVVTCALNENNEIFIIYGYSYPTDMWSWQIPGGGGDNEPPLIAAARELEEETGLRAEQYEQLGNLIVACGILKERMAVVVATQLSKGKRPIADDTDSIREGKFVSISKVQEMIKNNEICDSQSIAAIYLVEKWMEK